METLWGLIKYRWHARIYSFTHTKRRKKGFKTGIYTKTTYFIQPRISPPRHQEIIRFTNS